MCFCQPVVVAASDQDLQKGLKFPGKRLNVPTRQRHRGVVARKWVKGRLEASCRAHRSSLNSSCGCRVRDCSGAAIAAGIFWYNALCEGKLASLSSD